MTVVIAPCDRTDDAAECALIMMGMVRSLCIKKGWSQYVWNGPVTGMTAVVVSGKGCELLRKEHGLHRFVRNSPFDKQRRRTSSYVSVGVFPMQSMDDVVKQAPTILRSYVFDPYQLGRDMRTGVESSDPKDLAPYYR